MRLRGQARRCSASPRCRSRPRMRSPCRRATARRCSTRGATRSALPPASRRSSGTPATAPPSRSCRPACTTTRSSSSRYSGQIRGLLAINHEYTDDGLLHADGMRTWTAEKVRKSQAAHGGGRDRSRARERSVAGRAAIAVRAQDHGVHADAASRARRRAAARCRPRRIPRAASRSAPSTTAPAGARRGAPISPARRTSTAISSNAGNIPPEQRRYGISAKGAGYRWHEFDERFDAAAPSERAQPPRLGGRDRSLPIRSRCR